MVNLSRSSKHSQYNAKEKREGTENGRKRMIQCNKMTNDPTRLILSKNKMVCTFNFFPGFRIIMMFTIIMSLH